METPERKIYLMLEEFKVGFGSTGKVTRVENYYEAVKVGEEQVQMFLLDIQDQRMGRPTVIPKERLNDYIYCPDYFKGKKGEDSSHFLTEKHVQMANRHLAKSRLLNAESEYTQALKIEENHLQANLGMGKIFSAKGEEDKAKEYFNKLSSMEELFEKENKHVFNELAIELRKKGMLDEAIANYQKALTLDPEDWVLYYNLGRAYFEKGEVAQTLDQLMAAIRIKPDFEEAEKFLQSIAPDSSFPDQ